METTEATTGCLTDCDLGHRWSLCAPAEYAEPSAQCMSLHQPSSRVCQSTIIHHSLEKFTITSSTVNQSNHRNEQYSVIAVTDDTGAIVERYSYTAYGEPAFFDGSGSVVSNSQISNRYTYTGREFDPTIRLYHYRARMYDSGLGRFLGRDPIGYGDGPNQYHYVQSHPVGSIDPWGLQTILVPRMSTVPRVHPQLRIYRPPYEPFQPPFPVPVPMPTGGPQPGGGPDPQGVPIQEPNPDWWDPSAHDLPPPGKCTPQKHRELSDAKWNACNNPPPKKCGWYWGSHNCTLFSDLEKKWRDCAKARRDVMIECFGGGNDTHREEHKDAIEHAEKCEDKWFYWCIEKCLNNIPPNVT